MFYCDKCRKKEDYPESIAKSYGTCELCGSGALCNDVSSSRLPKKDSPVETVIIGDAGAGKTTLVDSFTGTGESHVQRVIKKISQQPQVQYSLQRQLHELKTAANKLGLYDAADYLSNSSPPATGSSYLPYPED